MGLFISHYYQSLGTSEATKVAVQALLRYMQRKGKSNLKWCHIKLLISNIPEGENILTVQNEEGYNLLQQAVGFNCVELVKWILNYGCDVNWGTCSLPLHIAAMHASKEIFELLLECGADVGLEARMCFPGPHSQNCELKSCNVPGMGVQDQNSDQLQPVEYFAISGDQSEILELLMSQRWYKRWPWETSPFLCFACKKGAWNCTKFLLTQRSEEVNGCYGEYYPIHQAAKQDVKFLELLLHSGADLTVKTATQKMTVLHVVLLQSRKSAKVTLEILKWLVDHGCHKLINEPDTLGNTPLHDLIIRYGREESRFGSGQKPRPWNKRNMLQIMRYLFGIGAFKSINHQGNSALACVLEHVKDLEFRYELLEILLQNGGDPDNVGRDGTVPLMACLLPLITKDPLQSLDHDKMQFYINSVLLLCKHGANPNCSSSLKQSSYWRSNKPSTRSIVTPMHILVFTVSEYIPFTEEHWMRVLVFIRKLLVILLQHGLDPNVQFSEEYQQEPCKLPPNDFMRQQDTNIKLCQLYEHIHQILMDMAA